MVNFDGTCYTKLSEVPEYSLKRFFELPIHKHHLLVFRKQILQLEAHYFSIMAALRRSRIVIPMEYTLEYFQEQVNLIYANQKEGDDFSIIALSFHRKENPTELLPVSEVGFCMQIRNTDWKTNPISLTLYKDYPILADAYSNLYQTNEPLRKLAEVFAYENDYGACLLLNNEKKIVESSHGTLFLMVDDKVFTPTLSSGTVHSVSRTALINFIKKNTNYEIVEDDIAVFALQRAAELFLFSYKFGLTKVGQFRKKEYTNVGSSAIEESFFNYLKNQL